METGRGAKRKTLVLAIGLLGTALAAGGMLARHVGVDESVKKKGEVVSLNEKRDPETGQGRYSFSVPSEPSAAENGSGLQKALQEIFRVERVNSSGDPRQKERGLAKKTFHEVEGIIRELEAQGLKGEDLFDSAEARCIEANDETALKMLEGVRRLERDLEGVDLDSTSPAERFGYVVKARREAFGEETADHLFFEEEAYTRYKFEEMAVLEDPGLTEAEQQAEITARRNALQVDLASRGSYVSFADERRSDLDRKLRERYGEGVDAMSDPERTAAIWEMYREELPPEMLAKAEQILAAQEQRKAVFEAYRKESEAILGDENLSFEEKQERLVDLSAQYNAQPSGAGLR